MITKQTQNLIREIINLKTKLRTVGMLGPVILGLMLLAAASGYGLAAVSIALAISLPFVSKDIELILDKIRLKEYEEYAEAIKSKFSHANSEITDDEIIELIKSIRDFEKTFYYRPRVKKTGGRAIHLKEEHYETFLNCLKEKESVSNLLTLAKLGANRQDCHIDFFKEKELQLLNPNQKVPSLTNLAVIKMAENNIKLPESLSHHGALYEIGEAYRLETPGLGKRKSNECADDVSFNRPPFKRAKRMLSH